MISLLANIDVDDLAKAEVFYCQAFGLSVGRRLNVVAEVPLEAPVTYASMIPGQDAAPTPLTSVYGNG
jgi:hypothetical protein